MKISNGDPKSCSTTLALPATWAEFHDALQKARIEDARHCENELLRVRRKELPAELIGRNVNLYELNLLAQLLTVLTDGQMFAFEGLLKMEREAHPGAPLPLPRLINLTFNTDQCCVAACVCGHKELGEFLFDSGMLSGEATALLKTTKPDSEFRDGMLALLGKQHMEEVGGVITSHGYVEMSGEIDEVYVPGEMSYFDRTGAPVVLQVSKGFFNDPDYDNDLTATLDLPAIPAAVDRAVEAVGAVSVKECGFRCVDCLIPAAIEWINDTIDEEGGIGLADAFARKLHEMQHCFGEADQIKYKALLEAAHCSDLEDAMTLAEELPQYELRPEIAGAWDYAEARVREQSPDIPPFLLQPVLFQTSQAAEAGREMMEKDHAALTDYDLVRRRDGQPLPDLRHKMSEMDVRRPKRPCGPSQQMKL